MISDGLLWHRIQFAFTITYHYLFPAVDDGLGAAHRCPQGSSLSARARRSLQRSGPLLGTDLRAQFRDGGRDGHPAGISVRHQLGHGSQLTRERSSARLWPWRECSPSFWSPRSWACFSSAKNAWGRRDISAAAVALVSGLLAVGLLHHRHQCVHATPRRLHGTARWDSASRGFLGVLCSIPGRSGSMRTT